MRLDIDEIASTTLSHLPKRKLNDVKVSGRGLLILWWLGSKRVLDRRSGRPGIPHHPPAMDKDPRNFGLAHLPRFVSIASCYSSKY